MLIHPDALFPPRAGTVTRQLIDVRSPGEVAQGSMPGALSIPILEDDERHAVGVRYAQDGQTAAIEEGRQQTEADLERRTQAWREAAQAQPSAFFCWRGGLRSELAQRFAAVADTPRVAGGYKAIRAYLMGELAANLARRSPFVVTGPTGSGKTDVIRAMADQPSWLALDLEAAAEHRGSAFGGLGPQPSQATFDHRLAIPLQLGNEPLLLLEDESRNIGRVHLPVELYDVVRAAPLLVLEASDEERLRRIHREYAVLPAETLGEGTVLAALKTAISKLRKRLGGVATDQMLHALTDASAQGAWQDAEAFRPVILPLLREYYDPKYQKATSLQDPRVVARGTREELVAWLKQRPEMA